MAIVKAMKAPSRPAGLPEGVLEGIPEGPGVYVFHGENDLPIYVGKQRQPALAGDEPFLVRSPQQQGSQDRPATCGGWIGR
jgi:hypothetical protein